MYTYVNQHSIKVYLHRQWNFLKDYFIDRRSTSLVKSILSIIACVGIDLTDSDILKKNRVIEIHPNLT